MKKIARGKLKAPVSWTPSPRLQNALFGADLALTGMAFGTSYKMGKENKKLKEEIARLRKAKSAPSIQKTSASKISIPKMFRPKPKKEGVSPALKFLGVSALTAGIATPAAHRRGRKKGRAEGYEIGHRVGHEHARENIRRYLAAQRKALTGSSKPSGKSKTASLDRAIAGDFSGGPSSVDYSALEAQWVGMQEAAPCFSPNLLHVGLEGELDKIAASTGIFNRTLSNWKRRQKKVYKAVPNYVMNTGDRIARGLYKATTKSPPRGGKFSKYQGPSHDDMYEAARDKAIDEIKSDIEEGRDKVLSAISKKLRSAPKSSYDVAMDRARANYQKGRALAREGAEKGTEFAKEHKKELAGGGALLGLMATGAGYHKAKQEGLIS